MTCEYFDWTHDLWFITSTLASASAHAALKRELSKGAATILLARNYDQALGANAEMQMAYQLQQASLEDSSE
ncbi:hypothetical protein PQX77_021603 [Marasmius sp. AFHP31]|nr:hypothetical protein PQX77_021603 [Marasmius sp. AFHP31]